VSYVGEKFRALPFPLFLRKGWDGHRLCGRPPSRQKKAARGIFMMEYIDLVVFDGGRFW